MGSDCALLPPRTRGPARQDDRKVLNGIFYILRTGAPWRDLPVRWGRKGVWKAAFEALARQDEDSLIFIDASIVKAHRAAAGAKKGVRRRPDGGVYRTLTRRPHEQGSRGRRLQGSPLSHRHYRRASAMIAR